jgi:hypothetical protein
LHFLSIKKAPQLGHTLSGRGGSSRVGRDRPSGCDFPAVVSEEALIVQAS